jgi:hypothetical protein
MDINAYVDESGDPYFTNSSSEYLVYCAVIIRPEDENEIEGKIREIKTKFNLKEIKSNALQTEGKRIDLLQDINTLPIKTITLVINKPEVMGEWKNYWRSFYKRTQRLLNRELFLSYSKSTTKIDKFSGKKYQDSLIKYLEQQIQVELWDSEIFIDSAKNNEIIQVADLFAGTNRKLFACEFKRSDEFKKILEKNNLKTKFWPINYEMFSIEEIPNDNDRCISKAIYTITKNYLTEIPETDPRSITLQYLLFEFEYGDQDRFVYTNELLSLLDDEGHRLTEEEFRTSIIGDLRSRGVVICGSNKGLKLPTKVSDVIHHFENTANKFIPMLRRLIISFESIKTASLGEIDLLNSDEIKMYKDLLKAVPK